MDSQTKQAMIPILWVIILSGLLIAGLVYLFGGSVGSLAVTTQTSDDLELEVPLELTERIAYEPMNINSNNPVAVIATNYGTIELELFDDAMPITAGNFMKLAREDFYNGTKFHRVIEGFMVQGGDPNTKTDNTLSYGTGGPGYAIPDEHIAGDKLTNLRGTISMANSGPESGGSQFFINLVDNTNLDYDKQPLQSKHPVFGQVIAGMDVIDTIGGVETGPSDLPLEDVVVESVTIRES